MLRTLPAGSVRSVASIASNFSPPLVAS